MATLSTSLNAATRSGSRGFFISALAPSLNSTPSAIVTATIGAGGTQETVSVAPESSGSQWLNVVTGSLAFDHGAGEVVVLSGT